MKQTFDYETVQCLWDTVVKMLIRKGRTITAMESCTGGLIASLITGIEGSSQVFPGSFVTYSNESKTMQGVPSNTIEKYGVYSDETAVDMAEACYNIYETDIAIGVTGTFENPDPENADSVVGEVHTAVIHPGGVWVERSFDYKRESRLENKLEYAASLAENLIRLLKKEGD